LSIKLGSKVKSKISGFVGIVTQETRYLNGCLRYGITPKVGKDNKQKDAQYFDFEELEVMKTGSVKITPQNTGADYDPEIR